jgi:hypothetical protein
VAWLGNWLANVTHQLDVQRDRLADQSLDFRTRLADSYAPR